MTGVADLCVPDVTFDARLREVLRSDVEFIELIGDDLVAAGGKRVRPTLVLLAAQALGARPGGAAARWSDVVDLGVGVELLHSASLLHDDLIDDADTRRGQQAAFRRFGNVVSVMSGDFMLSRLLVLLSGLPGSPVLTRMFGQTASVICEGEVLQFQLAAYQEYELRHYLQVIHGKTAALTELAASAPAVLLGASAPVQEALATFGREYGMAFQMQDDLLDLSGEEALIGKPVGGDLREAKPTPLLARAVEAASAPQAEVLAMVGRFDLSDDDVARVQQVIIDTGALADLERTIDALTAESVTAIRVAPITPEARHELEALANFLSRRTV